MVTGTSWGHTGGHTHFLSLPLFIADGYARNIMCRDNSNARILNKGMFSDMIRTSVSGISQISEKDVCSGYMTREMYDGIWRRGVGLSAP